MIMLPTEFDFEDIIYLKTDPEQRKRILLSITCFKRSEPRYVLGCGTYTSDHFAAEMSKEVDVLIGTTN